MRNWNRNVFPKNHFYARLLTLPFFGFAAQKKVFLNWGNRKDFVWNLNPMLIYDILFFILVCDKTTWSCDNNKSVDTKNDIK